MTQLWNATVTHKQYDFLRANIKGFPEGEPIRSHIKVGFEIDALRDILIKIDRMGESPRDDITQGEIAEMYLNVDVAFQAYEDSRNLR